MKRTAILIMLLLLHIGTAGCQAEAEDSAWPGCDANPLIAGTIAEKTQRILVVDMPPDQLPFSIDSGREAYWFWVDEDTEIVDANGHPFSFAGLEVGMAVKVWNVGVILESYPAQTTAKKIIVLD